MRRPALVLVALLFPLFAFADSGSWGSRGISRRFAVRDNLVFDADGRGLSVYDVRNPASIQRIAVAATDDESLDVALIGSDQLVLLTRAGLERYTIAPDGRVSLLSVLPLQDGPMRLAASDDGRYLAIAGPVNVTVLSVTSDSYLPAATIRINGSLNALAFHRDHLLLAIAGQAIYVRDANGGSLLGAIAVNAAGIAVDRDTAYIAAGVNGLVIADLTDDTLPVVVSRTGAGEFDLNRIAVSGGRAFASEGNDVIRLFDTSSPAAPVLIGTIRDSVQVIAASRGFLYVSGTMLDPYLLRTETGIPIRAYDTTVTPARIAGEYRDLAGPVSGVATDGTFAYVVDPPFLRVIDVSRPAESREVAKLEVPNIQDHIRMSGTRAVVYGRGDVDLFDLSDPYHPALLGVFVSFGRPPSNAAFAGTGDTVIEGNPISGFHVIDFNFFGDPKRPVQIAGIKGHYREIVGRGDHAFLFGDPSGLRAVNLSVRGEATVTQDIFGVAAEQAEIVPESASHPELLLASFTDGIRIYNAADPHTLVESGFVRLPHSVTFASINDTSWLALDGRLVALDLASGNGLTPTDMRVSAPQQVAVAANGKIVVADTYSLRVYGPATAPPTPPVVTVPPVPPPPPPPPPILRSRAVRH